MQNGIEFFTATCLNWIKVLEKDDYKKIITDSLQFLCDDQRIWVYGFVIMPNHVHILWAKQDAWQHKDITQMFLKYTAQQIKFKLLDSRSPMLELFRSTQSDRVYHFWERRPHVAGMHSRDVLIQKLYYMHDNPVKAGLCAESEQYRFSSARFYWDQQTEWKFLTYYTDHI